MGKKLVEHVRCVVVEEPEDRETTKKIGVLRDRGQQRKLLLDRLAEWKTLVEYVKCLWRNPITCLADMVCDQTI